MKPLINILPPDQFFLIAGPCVVEDERTTMKVAAEVALIKDLFDIPVIFKSSYKKANRTSSKSFTGIGDVEALQILRKVKEEYNIPVITDVHSRYEVLRAEDYVDVLQIPAFLCRQNDILQTCAETGLPVNIKKGQFLAPESMHYIRAKMESYGCKEVWITERGTSFGYHDLIVDFEGLANMMHESGHDTRIVLDVSHCFQKPNQAATTKGNSQYIEYMARLGITAGVDGIFVETHPFPATAKSDKATQLQLDRLLPMVEELVELRKLTHKYPLWR